MFDEIYRLPDDLVTQIEWQDDPLYYDYLLYQLGEDRDEFWALNPDSDIQLAWSTDLKYYIEEIPNTRKCIVFTYQGNWFAKIFKQGWYPYHGYETVEIEKPELIWSKNPDLALHINAKDEVFGKFEPTPWDIEYKLIWYVDPECSPIDDKIWAFSCQPLGKPVKGTKDMGYVTVEIKKPELVWTRNPELDDSIIFEEDIFDKFEPTPWDLDYKLIWYVDPAYGSIDDKVWAFSCQPVGTMVKGTKDMGYVTVEVEQPELVWHKNPELDAGMTFEEDLFQNFKPSPWDFDYKLVWYIDSRFNPLPDKVWAFSCQPIDRAVKGTKDMGYVIPQVDIEFNPHLPQLLVNIDDCVPAFYDIPHECAYELDAMHGSDKQLWVLKFTPRWRKPKEWKWLGAITPGYKVEYNPHLPEMEFDVSYVIPWHDLGFEHVWMLDRKHLQNGEEDIWAFKITCSEDTQEVKIVDDVSPKVTLKINKSLDGYNFNIDSYAIPYHDFKFEQVWKLDKEYSNGADIWAVKAKVVARTEGWKEIGTITPTGIIEYNPELKNLRVKIDYTIPYYDRQYMHVWYLDKLDDQGNKIWAARMATTVKPIGEKEMGIVVPEIPDDLDVIFISYNEPDADRNWKRVLEKAPHAKRVSGVKGIFQAHKAAAKLASTDMFYVVDGDAYLLDTWKFDFQPSIFDRDCTYIWCSINPINDLVYGYGGVKLFSKKKLLRARKWTKLDMSTTVSKKIKIMPETSNYTNFNTDDYSTWRSAFRECVKLTYHTLNNPKDVESADRLSKWLNVGETRNYGITALDAADQAVAFTKQNMLQYEILLQINNDSWLQEQYNKHKGL